jgi:arylsulfatase A-like enzyme
MSLDPVHLVRRARNAPRSLLLGLSTALVAACSVSEAADHSVARLESLVLSPAADSAPAPRIEFVRRLEPDGKRWRVEADCKPKFIGIEEGPEAGTSALYLERTEEASVIIPGPFDPSTFGRIGLRVTTAARRPFRIEFQNGRRRERLDMATRNPTGAEILTYDLPTKVKSWKSIDRIRIWTFKQEGSVILHDLTFFTRPQGTQLPSAESGAEHIEAQGQTRLGVGLIQWRPVETEFEARPGDRLRFSYVVPPSAAGGQLAPVLTLRLEGDQGGSETREFPFEAPSALRWQLADLRLDAFAGQRVRARWEIGGEGEPACAIGEVGLLHAGAPRRVLLITSDTHRFDHLGVAERGVMVSTPALDELAARGLFFEDCFSSTNVTNPSHISLMTGVNPRDTGIRVNNLTLSEAAPTLAEAFKQAGFATYASVSVKHLGPKRSGLGQGFDRSAYPALLGEREGAEAVDDLLAWADESDGLSVFAWLHLFDAHTPYETEDHILAPYYGSRERAYDESVEFPEQVPSEVREAFFPDLQDLDLPRALYRAEISYLDEELRRVFDHSLFRDAVVAFTADHGESLGEHGIYFSHEGLYPDTLHIPMILSYPGGPMGLRSQAPVQLLDLGRTLLDLAGATGLEFPGRNLLSFLDQEAGTGAPRFAISAHDDCAAITKEGRHLMLYLTGQSGTLNLQDHGLHQVELYDLREDPECMSDRVEIEPDLARELRGELVSWLQAEQHLGWEARLLVDEETVRALEALGYAAGTERRDKRGVIFDGSCSCDWCLRFE